MHRYPYYIYKNITKCLNSQQTYDGKGAESLKAGIDKVDPVDIFIAVIQMLAINILF